MEDKRWDDLNNFKTCPLCGSEDALFVDILEEHNKEADELAAMQAEVKALQEEISFLEAGHLQAENARLRDALRECLQYIDVDNLTMQSNVKRWRKALKASDE